HQFPALLAEAAYGLAEFNAEAIADARLVAVPGCYPTASILAIRPLVEAGLVDLSRPAIVDATSGVSGAGRKAEVHTLLPEASDNFKAYGVAGHRHHPELIQQLKALAGRDDVALTFVPHLTPLVRGMLTTLYARIAPQARDTDFQALFEN
ncbi:MAG: Asd/ArgC dimerization domain-containing protein, partial [bacterium]